MRIEEAKIISNIVLRLAKENRKSLKVLNIGSSTGKFRSEQQPHINRYLFSNLEEANIEVIHQDIKDGDGVDFVGDILDTRVQKELKKLKPNLILLNNVLEHIHENERNEFIHAIQSIAPKGTYILVSVPYSYPLHLDPIDSYYRPSPKELVVDFSGNISVEEWVIDSETYFQELVRESYGYLLKLAVRIFLPFYKFKVWICILHRFLWVFRPYKVTIVLLKA